jgi:hypothetical protein
MILAGVFAFPITFRVVDVLNLRQEINVGGRYETRAYRKVNPQTLLGDLKFSRGVAMSLSSLVRTDAYKRILRRSRKPNAIQRLIIVWSGSFFSPAMSTA